MSDRCCWPRCRNERDCLYLGKPLCDAHCDMVMSEDDRTAKRSRRKIGLPPITVSSGSVTTQEKMYSPPPIAELRKPKNDEEEEFDLEKLAESLEGGAFDQSDD